MNNLFGLIIIAALGGVLVTLQAQFISLMDQRLGTMESVFITYVGGGFLIFWLLLALRGGNLEAWRSVPWYVLTSGFMGLLIIGAISYSVSRLGVVTAFTVMVASQFIVGALFDHFGLLGATTRPLDLPRLVGIVVLLLGVWLIVR